ncbi:MAG: CheB methylesterase domain-containing protein, partial [Sulfitobacter sp.]|nr:CheB methylesterase domain-containing protein [Sulfitobacter sp.]
QAGQRLQPGYLYLPARYGEHVRVTGTDGLRLFMSDAPPRNGHRPSIDELFSSLADLSLPTLGILLTGMGRDGAEGLRKMRAAGNLTIAQDAASSLVYGMPRAAVELGAATEQLSPQQIGHRLAEICLT